MSNKSKCPYKAVTDEEVQRMMGMRRNGFKVREIAEKLGRHKQTVSDYTSSVVLHRVARKVKNRKAEIKTTPEGYFDAEAFFRQMDF